MKVSFRLERRQSKEFWKRSQVFQLVLYGRPRKTPPASTGQGCGCVELLGAGITNPVCYVFTDMGMIELCGCLDRRERLEKILDQRTASRRIPSSPSRTCNFCVALVSINANSARLSSKRTKQFFCFSGRNKSIHLTTDSVCPWRLARDRHGHGKAKLGQ